MIEPLMIPTGLAQLDAALSGGIGQGILVDIVGTDPRVLEALSYTLIAAAQGSGRVVALIDTKHAFALGAAERHGVKGSSLLLAQPDTPEQAFDVILGLLRTEEVPLLVVDSASMLVPSNLESARPEERARFAAQRARSIASVAHAHGSTVVFLNEVTVSRDTGLVDRTPNVGALKFYASLRVGVTVDMAADDGSMNLKARVLKNKMAPPFTVAHLHMDADGVFYKE